MLPNSSSEAPSLARKGILLSRDRNPHLRRPVSASLTPTVTGFNLRPRSNSLPIAEVAGLAALSDSPLKHGDHTAIPDGLMHPSTKTISSGTRVLRNELPPSAFVSLFGTAVRSFPIKKHKTRDHLTLQPSPASSFSHESKYYCGKGSTICSPPLHFSVVAPSSPSLMKDLSTPTDSQASPGNKKLSHFLDEGGSLALPVPRQETSSQFTPQGLHVMGGKLCINSPSPTLSPMFPTPGNSSCSRPQPINQFFPTMPTFSFSHSFNTEKNCTISSNTNSPNATDSPLIETTVFSARDTTQWTPPKDSKRSDASSEPSSPFYSLRVQHTPIGHQRGSSFTMLPPRLYPNGREETASSVTSVNENVYSTSCSASPSPSPRVVPLTVLSKDGSCLISAHCEPSGMPSPLMRSLDLAKEHLKGDLLSPGMNDVKVPVVSEVRASPMSSDTSQLLLPRIKLTPRGRKRFVPAMPVPSPEDSGTGLAMPKLTLSGPKMQLNSNIVKTASLLVKDCHGEKEAAEMDSLLNGFEHHKAALVKEDDSQDLMKHSFSRVESEEAEIAALTQGPFHWPPPLAPLQDINNGRCSRSSFTQSDGDLSCSSPDDLKPMPSITLDFGTEQGDVPSNPCNTSLGSLPSPLPIDQTKSRSLFYSSNARDPLEKILMADAIAEAARSNEPLTDEDSGIDDDNAGFLLCLPQSSQVNEYPTSSSKSCPVENKFPTESSCAGCCTKSPSYNRRAESPLLNMSRSGSFMRLSNCSGQSLNGLSPPNAPTIFEEGSATLNRSTGERSFHPMPLHEDVGFRGFNKCKTSDATFTTFCTLSDCDVSDIMASPNYPRTRALSSTKDRQSVCSLLSMSSLCGLDIVHKASLALEAVDKMPVLRRSESSELSSNMLKPMRSELSMNSLGLSVDSVDVCLDQRDVITPPVIGTAVANSKQMLSPPPLRCYAALPLDIHRH